MPCTGWWQFRDPLHDTSNIDSSQTTAMIGGDPSSGAVSPFGNSKRTTWTVPNAGFSITRDGSGNSFVDWGSDVFDSFGKFRIEYEGVTTNLNVAQGNAADGDWQVTNYAIGPYTVQVDTGYMGSNIYRMTVSEATGQRPELVFKMNGNMGSDSSTSHWFQTYPLNGQTHYYYNNVQNSSDPNVSNGDAVVYMTVVPMDYALDNLFTVSSPDNVFFNAAGVPIKLPFTVYICAHNGGTDALLSCFYGVSADLKQVSPSGMEVGYSQIVSTPIPLAGLREVLFDADDRVTGTATISYQLYRSGRWTALRKGQGIPLSGDDSIRLKAVVHVPDLASDAVINEWRLNGYENQDAIFHG